MVKIRENEYILVVILLRFLKNRVQKLSKFIYVFYFSSSYFFMSNLWSQIGHVKHCIPYVYPYDDNDNLYNIIDSRFGNILTSTKPNLVMK